MPTSGGNAAKCPTGNCTYANATNGPQVCQLWNCKHYRAHGEPPNVRLRCKNCKELDPFVLDVQSNSRTPEVSRKNSNNWATRIGGRHISKDLVWKCPEVSQDDYNNAKLSELFVEPQHREALRAKLHAVRAHSRGPSHLSELLL